MTQENLTNFSVVIKIPVQWGDQDAFGHVNNTIYFRWYESARMDYSNRMGFSMNRDHVGPILASISCNFLAQVSYPDTVQIGSCITSIGRSSIKMDHRVFSETTGLLVADGTSTVVAFDYQANHSVPVPPSVRKAIESIEGREF